MASFNKVILMGNLTRDPELRYTPKGTAVAKLGLAVNRTWRDAEGQQQDETTFVDVDAFGKQAETLGQYMQKGRPVLVEGRLKLDQWEDKNTGQKRSKLGVILERFSFVGGGNQAGGNTSSPQSSAPSPTSDVPPFEDGPSDDEVPF
ncbi:MAG: single-stranded DNA-binding protein [Verrucomicrobiota bacterium]|nr:single-stranded DNA-binding protein [Verrucomicrobiota bacterium]MED5453091.1 single-stranded DNA-binding protein [Verrucomicrobiota bacterium]|tara:strand:- start:29 stop:469 length:441 start_codon:yes stop_codon:yes gene_type:complete